ncbi:MAG: anti-sigma factor family protein [Bacteroidota bacterium]
MRCPTHLEIQSCIDGELDAGRAARINEHLAYCQPCQGLAKGMTAMATLLRSLADIPPQAEPLRPFTPPFMAARRRPGLPRWVLVPVAACLLVALGVTWRHVQLGRDKATYISAFLEAHRTLPAGMDLPEPCDFGLGGQWE